MNPREQEALALWRLAGARLMPFWGGYVVGLWKDTDGAESRSVLRIIHPQGVEVVPLDDADVASAYKFRQCPLRYPGEAFPLWRRRAEAQRRKEAA
ncbi:MAG: hypothetical protein JO182_32685 [Acidobacteriaceae bacterium]|nr:hypothetical protein [Acidobacteriaceae bacterium]